MCLAICHHFYFYFQLLFATHSLRCRTSRGSFLPPNWFGNRQFTTKASQAARHALGTSRPSSITHLGTRKYPTQPSSLGLPDVSVVEQMTAPEFSKPFFCPTLPPLKASCPSTSIPRTTVVSYMSLGKCVGDRLQRVEELGKGSGCEGRDCTHVCSA